MTTRLLIVAIVIIAISVFMTVRSGPLPGVVEELMLANPD